MPKSSSISGRAVLAISLLVGFYVLALGISAALLFIAYEVFTNTHSYAPMKLGVFCIIGAGIILWSILPRFDKFQAPGPLLEPENQPELFEMLRSIAKDTGEEMPIEVFLIADVNAWVAQRGGILGLGSRRIMGLGLPLLQMLNVTELRAVLAHEFGHYYGGDTKLGPLVYNMRAAMGRTIVNLASRNSILQAPFVWYGNGALKITQGVSRQQEHAADELAARTTGSEHLADALRKIHGGGTAFVPYLIQEVSPLLGQGIRPKLAEGFGRFLEAPRIHKAVEEQVAEEIASGKGEPFDSHPPLRERLAALALLPKANNAADARFAISLLRNLDQLEAEMLPNTFGVDHSRNYRVVEWDRVGDDVYLPMWKDSFAKGAEGLRGVSPIDFPTIAVDLAAFGKRFTNPKQLLPQDELAQATRENVGSAFAVKLHQNGWRISAPPREPISLLKDSWRVEPFNILTQLKEGNVAAEAWLSLCQASEIATWDLSEKIGSSN